MATLKSLKNLDMTEYVADAMCTNPPTKQDTFFTVYAKGFPCKHFQITTSRYPLTEGNELVAGQWYRMTMRFFRNKQPAWPRANVTKSERIDKQTGSDQQLAENTTWTERRVDPSEDVEPPNTGTWKSPAADGERPKFRKWNNAPLTDDDEPLPFGAWKSKSAFPQVDQVTHTGTSAPLLNGPKRPLSPPQMAVPPRDRQGHAVGARAFGGGLPNIPEQVLSEADPNGIVCYKGAARCYVYSDYYEREAIVHDAPNTLSPGDWVRFKVVSDQDDILEVEAFEKIEKQSIVLPLYRGVAVECKIHVRTYDDETRIVQTNWVPEVLDKYGLLHAGLRGCRQGTVRYVFDEQAGTGTWILEYVDLPNSA